MNKTKDEIADLALNYASSDPDGHPSPEGYTEYQRGKLHGYIDGFEAAEPKWISVDEAHPDPEKLVMVSCNSYYNDKRFITIAQYIPKMDIKMAEEYFGDCDYNPEGWYEWQIEPDESYLLMLSCKVTHWMYEPKIPPTND